MRNLDLVLDMRILKNILITSLNFISLLLVHNFDLDGTMNWALGRYEWPYQFNMALLDNWKE